MLAPLYFSISFVMAVFFLASSPVQAQDFLLPAGLQASWCNTSWSVSGSTYTCTGGSGKITLPSDAVISTSNAIVFVANAGFELNNARLGNESSRVSLRAPNGGALVRSAVGAEVSGFIETSGTVDLAGTKVGEYIKSNGKVTLVGGSVAGNVESINSGVSATGGVVFGGEVKANGDVNLVGGSVEKRVTSTNNKVITQGTSLLGGATAHSGMSIKGSGDTIIKGDFIFTSLNAAYFEGVKMISGSSIGTAGTAYFKDSVIGTLTNPVDVRVNGSATVKLENSTIYGMVHVPDYGQWSPLITGDSRSHIYGECLRFSGGARPLSDPARLCDGSAVPPDPVDPAECKVELHVEHMIAGLPNQGRVVVVDEPGCEKPDSLDFIFGYVSPEDPPEKASLMLNGVDLLDPNKPKVSLDFSGGNEALLIVEYNEAGRLWLKIDAEDQAKKEFVSRPYGLCLETNLNHEEDLLFKGKDLGETLHPAGDDFWLYIRAVAAKPGDEGNEEILAENPRSADIICSENNKTLLNYRRDRIELKSLVDQPSGADDGSLGQKFYDHDKAEITLEQSISEVGVFYIQAEPGGYLGADMKHAKSQSSRIGRFVPAWLELGAKPRQNIGCLYPPSEISEVRGFTYQGQPAFLTDKLEVRGFNRSGFQTQNYKGAFWRFLDGSELDYQFYQEFSTPVVDQPSAIAGRVTPPPVFTATPEDEAFLPSGGSYSYTRSATPSALDNPFRLNMVIWNWHDQDGVYFKRDDDQPEDEIGFKPTVPIPVVALIGDSDFRLGRIRSENLIVPHGNSAQAPIVLEHWNGTAWQLDVDNDCTLLAPPTADSAERVIFPDSGLPDAHVDEAEDWNQSYLQITDAMGREPKFEPQGRVLLHHLLQHSNGASATWLCQQRSEDSAPLGGVCSYQEGGDAETRSSITFGIYQGSKPLIFRRELYRGL